MVDINAIKEFVAKDNLVSIESLKKYVEKKALSPAYDKESKAKLLEVANSFKDYLSAQIKQNLIQNVKNIQVLDMKSPVLYFSIDPSTEGENYSILLYGHLDKIPAQSEDKDAYIPKVQDNILYGKGAANDGYAFFSMITAIKAIQAQTEVKHPQIHVLIESSNESGSTDLKYYLDYCTFIKPNMVICLDSESLTYDNLWLTTSARGEMFFDLNVKVITKNIHCGKFGGIIPDSFMIIKELIKRVETIDDKKVTYPLLEKTIPDETMAILTKTATNLGEEYYKKIQLEENVQLLQQTTKDLYINNTYKPALFVTGQEGLPDLAHAGASLRPETKLRINIKTSPIGQVVEDYEKVKTALTENPPFNAPITISNSSMIQGCELKKMSDKLTLCLNEVSNGVFNKPEPFICSTGDPIPSVIILQQTFTDIPILLFGAAGMESNRYGIKENLNLNYWNDITSSLAALIAKFELYKQ